MSVITEEQGKKYVAGGGVHCPFCGSNDIEGGSLDFGGGSIAQEVSCLICDATWWDVYTLTGIEERP